MTSVSGGVQHRIGGTMDLHRILLKTDPAYMQKRIEIEKFVQLDIKQQSTPFFRRRITRVPVVVHVVYNTQTQNISDDQVRSQIDVLNRDFRKLNLDINLIPDVFKPRATDACIEFQLAVRDPNGNATTGITRTKTYVERFTYDSTTGDQPIKFSNKGGEDAWPSDKYLNIWVCELASNLLGYAQFPGGPIETDGVVINYKCFGTMGTAEAPFNNGRTATHEIGHWLNLLHIWGDDNGGCTGSDNVADTPNQAGPNYGCPTFPHITCHNDPNGDMFMNYMDYVNDACMYMFTKGQVARMHATLRGPRSSIIDSEGSIPPEPTHIMRIEQEKLGAEFEEGTTLVFDGASWIPKEQFTL